MAPARLVDRLAFTIGGLGGGPALAPAVILAMRCQLAGIAGAKDAACTLVESAAALGVAGRVVLRGGESGIDEEDIAVAARLALRATGLPASTGHGQGAPP